MTDKPATEKAAEKAAESKPAAKAATYVATGPLTTSTGTLAFATGAEVPAHVLDGDLAKANGWADNVKKQ